MTNTTNTADVRGTIRASGGIVHSDGNIFFTSGEQFLAAARAALAAPAQPAAPSDAAAGFFAFSDDCGFDRYDTAAEAKSAAQEMLDDLRMEAGFDEWPMNVTSVCWGAVMERATETNQEATDNGEEHCDYTLIGSAPPPVAARAAAQAATVDAEPLWRTDAEIVEQTEILARYLLSWKWGLHPDSPDAQLRNSQNTKAQKAWNAACEIQDLLTATDVENAVAEVDDAARAAQGGDK